MGRLESDSRTPRILVKKLLTPRSLSQVRFPRAIFPDKSNITEDEVHGCPFRLAERSNLKNILHEKGLAANEINEVCNLVDDKQYMVSATLLRCFQAPCDHFIGSLQESV